MITGNSAIKHTCKLPALQLVVLLQTPFEEKVVARQCSISSYTQVVTQYSHLHKQCCTVFWCAMLFVSAAYAVTQCLSVCPSRSCILSKRVNISSNDFSPSGSHTILVFPHQILWQYSDGTPYGGVGCRWRIKKSQFSTYDSLHRVLSTMRPSDVINRVPPDGGKLVTLFGGK